MKKYFIAGLVISFLLAALFYIYVENLGGFGNVSVLEYYVPWIFWLLLGIFILLILAVIGLLAAAAQRPDLEQALDQLDLEEEQPKKKQKRQRRVQDPRDRDALSRYGKPYSELSVQQKGWITKYFKKKTYRDRDKN
jgi:hypothetical protein